MSDQKKWLSGSESFWVLGDDFGVNLLHAGEGVVDVVGADDFEALFAHGVS